MKESSNKLKIAFVLGVFPAISETFIINQITDLKDKGIDVEIFSLKKGSQESISERYYKYNISTKTYYLNMPKNWFKRIFFAIPKIIHLIFLRPFVLFKVFNIKKYGQNAWSLKLLFWVEPWVGQEDEFDIIHCHFGPIANKFLIMKEILGLKQKIVTTLYGYDVSCIPRKKGIDYYKKLIQECSLFLVMSKNMRVRATALGIPRGKIKVHPISINVKEYPYSLRRYNQNNIIRLISVGRFVEKKGFDDLLRAVAIVKQKTKKRFVCDIVGDGVLKDDLHRLAKKLSIEDVVNFRGYMKLQDVIALYPRSHLYVQASKTASNGDME